MREAKSETELQTFTPAEVKKILRIGKNETYQGLRNGTIPSIRVGKRWIIPRLALERMLAGV